MTYTIIENGTNRLIACISNDKDSIVADGYEIIAYGDNEPIFEDLGDGYIVVKRNAWEMRLQMGEES